MICRELMECLNRVSQQQLNADFKGESTEPATEKHLMRIGNTAFMDCVSVRDGKESSGTL